MIADEMIHGRLPRSAGVPQRPRARHRREPLVPLLPPEQRGLGEWDWDRRLWEQDQLRRRKAGGRDGSARRCHTRIEEDTPIVAPAIAAWVCEEASVWLGEPFPRHWLCALLASRRPDLYQRLPRGYASGHDLPPPCQTV